MLGATIKNDRKTQTNDRNEELSLDRLLSKSGGSIFFLARMAMLRALDIDSGSPTMVEHNDLEKPTTTALREIAAGVSPARKATASAASDRIKAKAQIDEV